MNRVKKKSLKFHKLKSSSAKLNVVTQIFFNAPLMLQYSGPGAGPSLPVLLFWGWAEDGRWDARGLWDGAVWSGAGGDRCGRPAAAADGGGGAAAADGEGDYDGDVDR